MIKLQSKPVLGFRNNIIAVIRKNNNTRSLQMASTLKAIEKGILKVLRRKLNLEGMKIKKVSASKMPKNLNPHFI